MENRDAYFFHQGTNYYAYNYMGAHFVQKENISGVVFRVWAYNAVSVSVVGDFNGWQEDAAPMRKITEQGIWETFIPDLNRFDNYKFLIKTQDKRSLYKSDPYAFHSQTDGQTASKLYSLDGIFDWTDKDYIAYREKTDIYNSAINIYEIHAGSWKRYPDGNRYDYRKLADELLPYVKECGYTHVELMPVAEYPYDGSWGYQITGYYCPTSRFGKPEDFMYFVNKMHSEGIGVILDWVPAHFPKDENGLFEFDGGYLYECQGADRREHRGWGTRIFDYGRNEVQSFLVSNAVFWFDKYHIDGLRVDAVASMLYLDYDRKEGEWLPNVNGGKENLEAIAFLQKLNREIFARFKGVMMIAEESTSFPMVTKPTHEGGLGFNFKWNMGWMNDILDYISTDPLFRKSKHNKLTFSLMYAFSENFILPVSHDEVVHGKRSLIDKMWGNYEQKFATLRTFLAYMMVHPGKKLLFMGNEFAQFREWDFSGELEFFMLGFEKHYRTREFVRALNNFYLQTPALWEIDYGWEGFNWLISDDCDNNIAVFERYDKNKNSVTAAFNFSAVEQKAYTVYCRAGIYRELFFSEDAAFGGSGCERKSTFTTKKDKNGYYIRIYLPPLSAVFYGYEPKRVPKIKEKNGQRAVI